MPKWLSSTLIACGFFALVGLAFLPREIEVTVTNNVKNTSSTEKTVNYNGDVYERYYHNGAVTDPNPAATSEEVEEEPET